MTDREIKSISSAFDKVNIKSSVKPLPYTYVVNKDNTVTITGFTPMANGKVVIPEKIEKKSVTYISSYAFGACKSLENIELPSGIKAIYTRTFENCLALKSVYIPETVTEISDNAFLYESKYDGFVVLESLKITGKIGSYADDYAKRMKIDFISISYSS